MNPKRRNVLQNILGIASTPLFLNPINSFGQQGLGPIDGYDLIITGGRIIDPSQKFDQIADIGIRNQKIVEIKPQLTKKSAQTINANGKIITPGVIILPFALMVCADFLVS